MSASNIGRLLHVTGRKAIRASPAARQSLQSITHRKTARRTFASTTREFTVRPRNRLTLVVRLEKKYTEDHEWIELDSDGKTGRADPPAQFPTDGPRHDRYHNLRSPTTR